MASAKKAPAKKTAAKKVAVKKPQPTFKPRNGETLEYTKRNGELGTGKYRDTKNYGKGDWYILEAPKGSRKPTISIRPLEARRPVKVAPATQAAT